MKILLTVLAVFFISAIAFVLSKLLETKINSDKEKLAEEVKNLPVDVTKTEEIASSKNT